MVLSMLCVDVFKEFTGGSLHDESISARIIKNTNECARVSLILKLFNFILHLLMFLTFLIFCIRINFQLFPTCYHSL